MKRIAVLVSNVGTGTNLQAIIDAVKSGQIKGKIVVVIADSKDAHGLKRAGQHHIKTSICQKKEQLLKLLKKYHPDYIALAGWKQIITNEVIDNYPNRILNLHPGLAPDSLKGKVKNPDGTYALWNRGLLSEKAVKNFLDRRSTYAGSSVHFLSKEFDFGPVLGRCFEKVRTNDTIETLYIRLKKKENQLYVRVLSKLCFH